MQQQPLLAADVLLLLNLDAWTKQQPLLDLNGTVRRLHSAGSIMQPWPCVVSVSTLAIAACDSSASSLFDACSCSIRIDREGSRGQRQRRGGMGEDRSPSRSYRHEACHPSTTSSRPAGNPTSMHACIVRECMTDGSLASFACSVAHVRTVHGRPGRRWTSSDDTADTVVSCRSIPCIPSSIHPLDRDTCRLQPCMGECVVAYW